MVSDVEVRNAIQAVPDFQVDGKFDVDRYQLLLASQNPPQAPRDFEKRIRDNLQYGLIPSRLSQSAFVTNAEVDRVMRLLGEQRDVSFVMLPATPADTAAVTPAQIQDWYKSHADDYRQPETVRLEYVEVDGATLPPPVVDEAALRTRYEDEAAKFSPPNSDRSRTSWCRSQPTPTTRTRRPPRRVPTSLRPKHVRRVRILRRWPRPTATMPVPRTRAVTWA